MCGLGFVGVKDIYLFIYLVLWKSALYWSPTGFNILQKHDVNTGQKTAFSKVLSSECPSKSDTKMQSAMRFTEDIEAWSKKYVFN